MARTLLEVWTETWESPEGQARFWLHSGSAVGRSRLSREQHSEEGTACGKSASCAKAQRRVEEVTPVRDSWLQHSEQLFRDDEAWHQAGQVDLKSQCPTSGPAGEAHTP